MLADAGVAAADHTRHALCRRSLLAGATVLALLWSTPDAWADCTPAANVNITATCTGTTINQGVGAPGTSTGTVGYGDSTIDNLTVTVVSGATVQGTAGGIAVLSGGTVFNHGTISSDGVGVGGVSIDVTNTGTISGGSAGIAANIVRLNNSGRIAGGSIGIEANVLGNVTNSGTIIAAGGTAILFSGNADTLTLLPGSRIIGAIDMGGGADVVNFVGGRSGISTLLTLSNFTGTINASSSGQPLAVGGTQIATLDPTSFAMTDRALMDVTRGVSSIVGTRMNETASAGLGLPAAFAPELNAAARVSDAFDSIPGLSAYASDAVMFKNPTMVAADGTAVWARGFLGRRSQPGDDPTLKATSSYAGGAMGVDRQFTPAWRLGAFVGGGATRVSVEQNSGTTDSDLIFGGVFGRYGWATSFVDFALHGGGSQNKSTRSIASNLAPDGVENATARYDGWYVSPELAYGLRYALWSNVTLTPTLRVRYVGASYDGYAETGSAANLTVGSRSIHDVEERFDLALTHARPFLPSAMLITSVHAGVIGLHRLGDTTVNTVLLGANLPFVTPGQDNVAGVVVGGGIEWRTAAGISVFAAADYTAMSDSSALVSGKGGLRIAF
jgi:uncharacterized protein with beta-barrel porin domain